MRRAKMRDLDLILLRDGYARCYLFYALATVSLYRYLICCLTFVFRMVNDANS